MNQLLNLWTINWLDLLWLIGFGLLYGTISGWRWQRGAGLYVAGLFVIGLAQLSPLHMLGMHYLLSAHMAEHMLLLLVAAPLLILGLPAHPTPKAKRVMLRLSTFFQQWPWLGWIVGVGLMWFWHIPTIYDATMAHDFSSAYDDIASIPLCQTAGSSASWLFNLAHALHPVSLILAGMAFAWPVVGPVKSGRLQPLTGVVYLFTACAGCSLLGLLITFAPVGLYQTYAGADYYGLVGLIRHWGIDAATDQQVAGLLMWVPGCLIYLTGAMYLLSGWLTDTNEQRESTTIHLLWEEKL